MAHCSIALFCRTQTSATSFITPIQHKANSEWAQFPSCLETEQSCWILLRNYQKRGDQSHHVFMTTILSWTLSPASKQAICLSSTLQHASHLICPPSASDSPTSSLLAYNSASYLAGSIESVTGNTLVHPPPRTQAHPLPPVSWPFLPPTSQGWFIHMAQDASSPALSGKVHYPWPLFSLVPSQIDFSQRCLNNHKYFPFGNCLLSTLLPSQAIASCLFAL